MINEKDLFWKNFRLGTELQNAGSFIYNGIFKLDNIEYFRHEEDCFEFLYNLSIGIERLQKILIVLIENNKNTPQQEFEESLKTHKHVKLFNRIQKERELNFGKVHKKFLELLSEFYDHTRYERFTISSVYKPSQDKERLVQFIQNELKIEFSKFPTQVIENTDRVKGFLGKIVKRISISFYELIREEAIRIGIFTYEIRYDSKAYKIFMAQEFDFKNERLMQREVFLYLLRKFPKNELKYFIDNIEPLKFENYHTNHYIENILNIHKNTTVKDEMLYLYEEQRPSNDRLSEILAIGSDINFDVFNGEEGEEI